MGYLGLISQFGVSHRGGAAENLENTLSAFTHSINLGYQVLETDLQLTKDGEVVISHDDRLLRNFGLPGSISDMNFAELALLKQRNGDPILRFVDFLSWLPSHVRLNLDPKTDRVVQPLIEILSFRPELAERVCIGSFESRRLKEIREALPDIPTSLGAQELRSLVFASRTGGKVVLADSVVAVQAPEKAYGLRIINQRFVDFVHDLGLDVHVWTIDRQADMHRLYDLGVDAVMTDEPTTLKQVLLERGHWREHV